jgi:hypothetical protein
MGLIGALGNNTIQRLDSVEQHTGAYAFVPRSTYQEIHNGESQRPTLGTRQLDMPRVGIEPTTPGFSDLCSTD